MKEPAADYRGFVFVLTLNPSPKERDFKFYFTLNPSPKERDLKKTFLYLHIPNNTNNNEL
tara:strand:- start:234 stop:413 length:180 start_codon:yes stop_codon:yes gene_type:complete